MSSLLMRYMAAWCKSRPTSLPLHPELLVSTCFDLATILHTWPMEETRRCTSTVIPPLMNSVVVLGGGVVGEEDLRAATKRGIPIRNKKKDE
jgi:hypothetical protein